MPSINRISNFINSPQSFDYFHTLTCGASKTLDFQKNRHLALLQRFLEFFPHQQIVDVFSSPGRTEVGGNHTDHNAGRVLAAAVDPDILAVVAPNEDGVLRIHSEGYPSIVIRVDELGVVESERYTSASLVRGICARFQQLGYVVNGFDAVIASLVPKGSGLSSSAAYEVLIAFILNHLYNQDRLDRLLLAQISQYAENEYFGKPCGLMDQTTCAMGGFVTIDFMDFANPAIRKLDFDFSRSGYAFVIVDTKGDHSDLTPEYAALEREMKSVARALGGKVLREFSEQLVLDNLAYLRTKVTDRAILRAIHFYRDDRRVSALVAALERGDYPDFLRLICESGESSWMLCQNCYSPKIIEQQGIPIALTASEAILKGRGAWRVHGGGFAGTIQAFMPANLVPEYIAGVERIFGDGSCHAVQIRPEGVMRMPVD